MARFINRHTSQGIRVDEGGVGIRDAVAAEYGPVPLTDVLQYLQASGEHRWGGAGEMKRHDQRQYRAFCRPEG